ncbi:uncharacterized protein CIMG_08101 [Coccidioides immitis RS]|uniref:Uncharacterized protein n=1 Tax=Coccidioides immitis (strain RS) TaxID=246410 RepID=A0A0E1RVY3_COCIM|nr:uncharacterized protein CIMG_08101 [Coccidioides immitis RS]EAS29355.1 hypothetical protein CIMG_08101 [Coccidioides immitis RS]TPX22547.1 hypothetical protein DIZ76_014423 [Coccidioides immitis]
MTTSPSTFPAQVIPGRGIGFLTLGASLHNILTRLKGHPQSYPTINLVYSSSNPVYEPILICLPENGLRLRFDGPDQRLRLIEVLDFTKISLSYENTDFPKLSKSDGVQQAGPKFRHINRLFGVTYPGEYIPPLANGTHGTCILSYPGVAFSFSVSHSSWTTKRDSLSLMASSAASPAQSMAVFLGDSWAAARSDLFTRQPIYPRLTALAGKNKEYLADEIELVTVHGGGRIELVRKASAPFWITLSETTPQDLIAELGPPDAIYRKSDRRIRIHGGRPSNSSPSLGTSPSPRHGPIDPVDFDHTPDTSAIEDSDEDSSSSPERNPSSVAGECFYNYFNHGFDVFISQPTTSGPPFPGSSSTKPLSVGNPPQLTATKLILHGNIPGSYPFNRHRRSRWVLNINGDNSLNSETPYSVISERLKKLWNGFYSNPSEEAAFQRGMVLNRGWGDSPGSSIELLGGWEESIGNRQGDQPALGDANALGNTEIYGFPGSLFEVLKNESVSCLTIY